jgi:hypothetical protein
MRTLAWWDLTLRYSIGGLRQVEPNVPYEGFVPAARNEHFSHFDVSWYFTFRPTEAAQAGYYVG